MVLLGLQEQLGQLGPLRRQEQFVALERQDLRLQPDQQGQPELLGLPDQQHLLEQQNLLEHQDLLDL